MNLSYDTVKYVSIQDTRLGCLRYMLLAAIIIYVVVFELWAYGGWLSKFNTAGVVRFSLQQPTQNNCDPTEPECFNAFAPLDTLPYCLQSNQNTYYAGNVYPCEIYEAINAQVAVTETSLVILTRASTSLQFLTCGPTNLTCPRTYETIDDDNGPKSKFYIAQSEAFTVLIDHSVTSSAMCQQQQKSTSNKKYACSGESSQYNKNSGRLYSDNPQLCQRLYPDTYTSFRGTLQAPDNATTCYIAPNRTVEGHQDFFSLDLLLQAAGVTMDDCVNGQTTKTASGSKCETNTYRESGATLLLNIYWSDFLPYRGKVEPFYYYRAHVVGQSFKQEIPFYETYRDRRTLLNAHGIRIAVVIGGDFHDFQFTAFLITLTTALGLLAVANTVLDSLMLYILPNRELYQRVKYERTEEICDDNPLQIVDRGLSTVFRGSGSHGGGSAGLAAASSLRAGEENNNNNPDATRGEEDQDNDAQNPLLEPFLPTAQEDEEE